MRTNKEAALRRILSNMQWIEIDDERNGKRFVCIDGAGWFDKEDVDVLERFLEDGGEVE